MTSTRWKPDDPWLLHFFQRHRSDDPQHSVPALQFLDASPLGVRAKIQAVLDAVVAAPPPAFSGGLQWQAMHGDMAGYHEVRVMGPGRQLFRLYCVLENPGADLGGPSIVAIAGLSKRPGTAIRDRDYRAVRALGDEFRSHRTVLR